MLISIIVPTFNEKYNIEKVINNIITRISGNKQIIIIDDGSNDGTTEILKKKLFLKVDKIIFHSTNLGKGAAIKSSLPYLKGDIVAIQDSDLEYNPYDLNKLIDLIDKGITNVSYGSRVLGKKRYNNKNFISNFRIFGNHLLTIILNNQKLTDAHTCYKVFKTNIFKQLNLSENGFSFCPEVTTKLSKMNEKIIELPIEYMGRSVEEGKKIRLKDAFHAIYVILKYRL